MVSLSGLEGLGLGLRGQDLGSRVLLSGFQVFGCEGLGYPYVAISTLVVIVIVLDGTG